jgi:hypothetical protein
MMHLLQMIMYCAPCGCGLECLYHSLGVVEGDEKGTGVWGCNWATLSLGT